MNIWPFVTILVLLAVNGFFVAIEFALVASRSSRLEPLAEQGDRSAIRGLAAMRELSVQLAGAQLGITIASLLLGLVGEPAVSHLLSGPIDHIPRLPHGWVHPITVVLGLLIVVFAHMVLGEMVPKNITLTRPEATLRVLSAPNRLYLVVARPFVRVLNAMANRGVRLFGVEPRDELAASHTSEEIAVLVAASREEGVIPGFAAELLSGVLDFGGRDVASVMVPRQAVCVVPAGSTVAEVERLVLERGHTRLPVVGPGGIDQVLGFVHAKDLLDLDDAALGRPVPTRLMRGMLVVARSQLLEEVLLSMRVSHVHFALVTEEDGRTAGIVTLDDLLEELVGDITDEAIDRADQAPAPEGPDA